MLKTSSPSLSRLFLFAGMGTLLVFHLLFPQTITAQVESPNNYWRHSASFRIEQLLPVDIDNDNVDEFLIVAENGNVELLSSDGISLWSYRSSESVLTIGTLNIDGTQHPEREIVLGLQNKLILLSTTGQELWQTDVFATKPPLSLLTGYGQDRATAWRTQFPALPIEIQSLDRNGDGREAIAVLLQSGQVHLYDGGDGSLAWEYPNGATGVMDKTPQMVVGDLDKDGREEIVVGSFRRFSELTIIDANGRSQWDQPIGISGRITAITLVDFPDYAGISIAVGTDRGDLNLYGNNRQRYWPRTLNVPITAVSVAHLQDGPILMVGTGIGTVTAFSGKGQRIWARQLDQEASRPVTGIATLPYYPDDRKPFLSVILESLDGNPEPNDVWLLGSNGRTLSVLSGVDTTGLTQLVDINQDNNSELLLARFATVELVGTGIGTSKPAREWQHSLESAPRAYLAIDLDLDGQEELIVGAQNGRLHCLDLDNRLCWLTAPDIPITHLAELPNISSFPPNIVIVRNETTVDDDGNNHYASRLELRQANSDPIWQKEFSTPITALLIKDINERGQPEIIIGTQDGQIFAFTSSGTELWSRKINPSYDDTYEITIDDTLITQILPQKHLYTGTLDLIIVTPHVVYKINDQRFPRPIIQYESKISQLYLLSDQSASELVTRIILFTEDGEIHGHHWDGIQLPQWPFSLSGTPRQTEAAGDIIKEIFQQNTIINAYLVATDANELLRINMGAEEPEIIWKEGGISRISSLYWGDLNEDGLPDVAIGSEDNTVQLFTNVTQNPTFVDELILSSGVHSLMGLAHQDGQVDLAVLTNNGELELFRTQENRPPLLTNPQIETGAGQLSFRVDLIDVEGDEVVVDLEIQDTENRRQWISYGSRTTNSNKPLFWQAIEIPNMGETINYRFTYNDGSYIGNVTPPSVPAPIQPTPLNPTSPYLIWLLTAVGSVTAVMLIRQWQTANAQARRFYLRLKQAPELTLHLLERKYISTNGSQDFLLHLAGAARQQGDELISSLADGLFLLADRPHAGLSILTSALRQAKQGHIEWQDLEQWHITHEIGQALLEAPSTTELSLLYAQLQNTAEIIGKNNADDAVLNELMPIMINLRDSERVEQTDDQLVYLNEAIHQLRELQANLAEYSVSIEKGLVTAVAKRWFGLIRAEAEELRGRANLIITLKTKRLVPSKQTKLVIEVQNNGRAPAENIIANLQQDPAYTIDDTEQTISFLPPGIKQQITFTITPHVDNHFRVSLTLTYDDHNQDNKTMAFGDMVHLLQPARHFTPFDNPYLPGTPLRRKSPVFYGRERLFTFIEENIGGQSKQNVLILIGQRRTGKTSALLRLDERLPSYLLPVYIDCQSLGVVPGMPAFFHDIGWHISDALATRDIELDVPEPEAWQIDPTGLFQRQFLPYVQSLLSSETHLMLVFDEFEAFEDLVNDGILPPTFFTFLRHLMQHSDGLRFVFVGTRRLEQMSADYWSVLFNIGLYDRIRYLDEAAAIRLISEPVSPHLIYDDLAIDKMLRVTAGHPYFLQLVCYTLVKQANSQHRGYVTISDVNAGLDEMLSLGEVHFAYLWQRSSFAEQAILTAVSHMMDRDTPFHPKDFIDYLAPYGIKLTPSKVTAALNSLIEREIMLEAPLGGTPQYELQIGLVGLWVRKRKSLSRLHAIEPKRENLILEN